MWMYGALLSKYFLHFSGSRPVAPCRGFTLLLAEEAFSVPSQARSVVFQPPAVLPVRGPCQPGSPCFLENTLLSSSCLPTPQPCCLIRGPCQPVSLCFLKNTLLRSSSLPTPSHAAEQGIPDSFSEIIQLFLLSFKL